MACLCQPCVGRPSLLSGPVARRAWRTCGLEFDGRSETEVGGTGPACTPHSSISRALPTLTLLRASKRRPGDWSDDDFDVVDDERCVGRIMWTASSFTAGRDKPWFWTITCKVPNAAADRGNAASREEAMQPFKSLWLVVSANGRPRLP